LNANRRWSEAELPFQHSKKMAPLSLSHIVYPFCIPLGLFELSVSVLEQIAADKVDHHRRTFVGIFRR
jgi:hypothetical protein